MAPLVCVLKKGGALPQPLRPQPLWVRVDENRFKLAMFVATFVVGAAVLLATAFVGVPGVLVGGAAWFVDMAPAEAIRRVVAISYSAAFALLLGAGAIISAAQLANGESWVRSRFGAEELAPGSHPALKRAASDMALAAGLATPPRILVVEQDSVNAGVVGLSRASATLVVTRGMLERFDEGQLRAVVATLMARVISGDVLFGTALAALMGPLKALRDWRIGAGVTGAVADEGCAVDGCGCAVDALLDSDSPGGCAGVIGVALFAALVLALTYAAVVGAAWIVTVWGRLLHRTSHEKADAEGMLLLKDPAPMLSALGIAVTSCNRIADGDASYDSVFYVSTSGTPALERIEQRRYDRLREVLGAEGMGASGSL